MQLAKLLTAFVREHGGSGMKVPEPVMQEYLDAARKALEEVFVNTPKFPRVSNLGQDPLMLWCRLNYKEVQEEVAPKLRVTFFQGKILEALTVAIAQMAGLAKPEDFQVRGTFKIDGVPDPISGTLDWLLNGEEIRDIKTAHNDAFNIKWASSTALAESDDFNYIPQGYGYSRMTGKPFTGWLVINKNTGEWKDVLLEDQSLIQNHLMEEYIENSMRRAYEPERPPLPEAEPELYKGEPTGNIKVPLKWARTPYVKLLWPEAIEARRGEQKIFYLPPFNGIKIPGIKLVEKTND